MEKRFEAFERMFNPKSIAVVGVSAEGFGFGRGILLSLVSMGYAGELYPVNPSGGTISGRKLYPSIEAIPEPIDFAIIAVPARKVPDALESCRKKGAVAAEILSSGFTEVGTAEGIDLDRQIQQIVAKGIRVIGPNCFGIYCPESGLTMLPGPDLSRRSGPVAFLSQSGGLSIDFAYLGKWRGIYFSKMISFGNGCDLRETELLEYLCQDDATSVICLYVEGVTNGRAFLTVLRKAAAKKPVIVMKGGLSDAGGRAVASHTASMGGSRKIWSAALKQCNVVQVESLQEMADAALAFSMLPLGIYRSLTVVGGGGALGVNATDMAEPLGLSTPPLASALQEKIRNILPQPGSSPVNPIDIANPFVPPDILEQTLLYAGADENIHLQVMIQLLPSYQSLASILGEKSLRRVVPLEGLAQACSNAIQISGKPVVMILPNYKQEASAIEIEAVIREARQLFLAEGVAVFERVKDALKAIAAVSDYAARRQAIELSCQKNMTAVG